MSNDRKLPPEILQFESFLKRPNSDPTGLAGYFNTGEIVVTRVPARLDVMGGIADYSGANVCEGVLGRGMVIALQPRTDRTLRIRTMQAHHKSLPVETRIPLDYFEMGEGFVAYEHIQAGAIGRKSGGGRAVWDHGSNYSDQRAAREIDPYPVSPRQHHGRS